MPENAPAPEASSSSSWSDLLAELVRSFVLMRDVFGYLLPGAFFLLIGMQSGHLEEFVGKAKLPSPDSHPWLFSISFVVVSYILGHFLVATSYVHLNVASIVRELQRRPRERRIADNKKQENDEREAAKDKSADQQAADLLRYHQDFPKIFIEHDRQSIMALLRQGLTAALLLGVLVFYCLYDRQFWVMVVAGIVMLISCVSGYYHVGRLRQRTLLAARAAEARRPVVKHL